MRENRLSGSEGGGFELNRFSLPPIIIKLTHYPGILSLDPPHREAYYWAG